MSKEQVFVDPVASTPRHMDRLPDHDEKRDGPTPMLWSSSYPSDDEEWVSQCADCGLYDRFALIYFSPRDQYWFTSKMHECRKAMKS